MRRILIRALLWGAAVIAVGLGTASVATASLADNFGRGALRNVVAACAVSKSALGLSFPCSDMKLDAPGADGYAIIRSPGFASEFLLAAQGPMDGIESNALQADAATGFWPAAWAARGDVAAALGRPLPRTSIALAVNASGTRTQDHFHIHIDCVRPTVARILADRGGEIDADWQPLPARLVGERYWARAISGSDLTGVNVARLLAAAPPASTQPMAHATLAVVGARLKDGSDGFYLVANWANSSAERLLDHSCKIAAAAS
jgi:CDP-diacylglycerol pyrophosphatase